MELKLGKKENGKQYIEGLKNKCYCVKRGYLVRVYMSMEDYNVDVKHKLTTFIVNNIPKAYKVDYIAY